MDRHKKIGITSHQRLVFILGHPLEHSLSPLMHNAAFRELGMAWSYLPLEVSVEEVGSAVNILRSFNVQGANVTVPYKSSVLPFLDKVDEQSKWLGSVNTIYRLGNKLCGTSTDGEGFLRSIGAKRKKLKGSTGLLLGAGGAGKAVAGALALSGVKKVYLIDKSEDRALNLSRLIRNYRSIQAIAISIKESKKVLKGCDWIIQATTVGLKPGDPNPISLKGAQSRAWVLDLIYHRKTAFMKEAEAKGLSCFDGLGMLLNQGALSFEYWTGRPAPLNVMAGALRRGISSR